MNKKLRLSTLVLAAGLLAGSSAFAQLTREQVIADLVEAQRTGNIATGLDGNKKLNELDPVRYAQAALPAAASTTRDQVRAELIEAQRTGDVATGLDGNKKLNELEPARYASQQTTQGKTRAQVRAELIEAQRTGDITIGIKAP